MRLFVRKWFLLMFVAMIILPIWSSFAGSLDQDIATLDDIINNYWGYSDIKDRENDIDSLPKMFEVVYCHILEMAYVEKEKLFLDCPIEFLAGDTLEKFRNKFKEELLTICNNKYSGDILKILKEDPLPAERLGDRSIRVINVDALSKKKPFEITKGNKIVTIKVNHLLHQDRRRSRSSNISREPDRFKFRIDNSDVSKLILDLRGVYAADLSAVIYLIAQLPEAALSKPLDLVKYVPSKNSSNQKNVLYSAVQLDAESEEKRTFIVLAKEDGALDQIHYVNADLLSLSDIPLEIKVDEGTKGYAELIPIILKSVRVGVTVTGNSSGSITAELAMAGAGSGGEIIFSAGDLLITDGKDLKSHKFQKERDEMNRR